MMLSKMLPLIGLFLTCQATQIKRIIDSNAAVIVNADPFLEAVFIETATALDKLREIQSKPGVKIQLINLETNEEIDENEVIDYLSPPEDIAPYMDLLEQRGGKLLNLFVHGEKVQLKPYFGGPIAPELLQWVVMLEEFLLTDEDKLQIATDLLIPVTSFSDLDTKAPFANKLIFTCANDDPRMDRVKLVLAKHVSWFQSTGLVAFQSNGNGKDCFAQILRSDDTSVDYSISVEEGMEDALYAFLLREQFPLITAATDVFEEEEVNNFPTNRFRNFMQAYKFIPEDMMIIVASVNQYNMIESELKTVARENRDSFFSLWLNTDVRNHELVPDHEGFSLVHKGRVVGPHPFTPLHQTPYVVHTPVKGTGRNVLELDKKSTVSEQLNKWVTRIQEGKLKKKYLNENDDDVVKPSHPESKIHRTSSDEARKMLKDGKGYENNDVLFIVHDPLFYRPGGAYYSLSLFLDIYRDALPNLKIMTMDSQRNEIRPFEGSSELLEGVEYPFAPLVWFFKSGEADGKFVQVQMGLYDHEDPLFDLVKFLGEHCKQTNEELLNDSERLLLLKKEASFLKAMHGQDGEETFDITTEDEEYYKGDEL